MSKKTGVIVAVVLVVVLGVWYFINSSNKSEITNNSNQQEQNSVDQGILPTDMSTSSPTDTSDAGINQDIKAVDSNLNALGNDSVNANQDVSVTPAL
ncbi:MAG: hypothetical protein WCF92_00120 [bacterium]